jgi:hypothetical protein
LGGGEEGVGLVKTSPVPGQTPAGPQSKRPQPAGERRQSQIADAPRNAAVQCPSDPAGQAEFRFIKPGQTAPPSPPHQPRVWSSPSATKSAGKFDSNSSLGVT